MEARSRAILRLRRGADEQIGRDDERARDTDTAPGGDIGPLPPSVEDDRPAR